MQNFLTTECKVVFWQDLAAAATAAATTRGPGGSPTVPEESGQLFLEGIRGNGLADLFDGLPVVGEVGPVESLIEDRLLAGPVVQQDRHHVTDLQGPSESVVFLLE